MDNLDPDKNAMDSTDSADLGMGGGPPMKPLFESVKSVESVAFLA
jgi:hypothetical protein